MNIARAIGLIICSPVLIGVLAVLTVAFLIMALGCLVVGLVTRAS